VALIGLTAVTALATHVATAAADSNPPQAVTWGGSGPASTLVLYDTTNTYGWLGELYAMGAGNLASHFGSVTAEPVVDYVQGQVNNYTATIYLGSTYNEPLPTSFLNDVLSTTHPVIWAGDNVWQLSGDAASPSDAAFQAAYGWDPSSSWFDSSDTVASVTYNGQQLTRKTENGPVLAPHITTPSAVTVLAQANCTDATGAAVNCAPIAQASGTSFPWAIRSGNLTYIGEIPLSYMTESDRYLAFSDLLFDALAPGTQPVHQALVRLEDVSPGIDTPQELEAAADYLYSQHVPFTVGVIPEYLDPNGFYNNGTPVNENISQTSNATIKAFDAALQYMQARGGTIIEHGDTHQYSNVANPYDGTTGDDFEFYRAWCSTTQGGPADATSPCPNTDYVVQTGPLPNDSQAWAQSKAATGQSLFAQAGLPTPAIWETPHYSASAADYAGIGQVFQVRYERGQYFGGQLSGGSIDYSHQFGQFFPYVVHDIDGSTVIPENLGNYEPDTTNNNPPRPPAVIVANAQAELAVRQGVASFFFHPYYGLTYLQQTVQGIQALGYTFVPSTSLIGQSPYVPVSITTTSLPAAGVGQAYSANLAAADGTAPYKWSVSSGSLPAGLSLNGATGAIGGTPSAPGQSTVTFTATDSTVTPTVGSTAGSTVLTPTPGSASTTLTLTVNPAPLTMATSALPAASVGQPYSASLSSNGGVAPYTWSVSSGSLPAGLSLNPTTGAVTGMPTAAGSATVGFTVTDSSTPSAASVSKTLTVTVNPAKLAIATGSLPAGTAAQPYSATVAASGGAAPYVWSATGLPQGVSLNTATGGLSGTPANAGTFSVKVKATDSSKPAQTASATLTLTVNPALAINSSSLPAATVGQPYSASLSSKGGVAPYTWSVSSGSLPAGLSLNSTTGAVTGTPTAAGSGAVGFTVTDSSTPNAASVSKTLTVTVNAPPLAIVTGSLPIGTMKQPYSATLTASGGTAPYVWSASGLPAGLTLNAATGVLSGTPTRTGSYSIRVKLTDSSKPSQSGTATLQAIISA
jgi:uncharacterized protein YdaL